MSRVRRPKDSRNRNQPGLKRLEWSTGLTDLWDSQQVVGSEFKKLKRIGSFSSLWFIIYVYFGWSRWGLTLYLSYVWENRVMLFVCRVCANRLDRRFWPSDGVYAPMVSNMRASSLPFDTPLQILISKILTPKSDFGGGKSNSGH